MKLPKHNCSLTLEHNPHKESYDDLDRYLIEQELYDEFKDDASREESLVTDELWILHWYPDTPVGFYTVCAPTLDKLLEFAQEKE